MTTTAVHPYIESLLTGTREIATTPHAWLDARRSAALERANALSVPTTRDEEWRFTDLTALTRLKLTPAGKPAELTAAALDPYIVPEAGARLVFIDGVYAPQLSDVRHTRAGGYPGAVDGSPRVMPFAQALASESISIEPYLATLASFDKNVFAALNTAHLRDGALVLIPANAACEKPVHVLSIATQPSAAAYPRCLVIAESGCECTVIEEYVGLVDEAYLTNAVTEIAVAPTARLRHVRLQRETGRAFHIATCAVTVGKDGTYTRRRRFRSARAFRATT
jgi:Fe-S cluster assembly protein SufD